MALPVVSRNPFVALPTAHPTTRSSSQSPPTGSSECHYSVISIAERHTPSMPPRRARLPRRASESTAAFRLSDPVISQIQDRRSPHNCQICGTPHPAAPQVRPAGVWLARRCAPAGAIPIPLIPLRGTPVTRGSFLVTGLSPLLAPTRAPEKPVNAAKIREPSCRRRF